jgi:hypothetical protein
MPISAPQSAPSATSTGSVPEVADSAVLPAAIPGSAPPFTLVIGPADLQCLDGEILPAPIPIRHRVGVNGIADKPAGWPKDQPWRADPSPAIACQMRKGRIPVPEDIEVVAFGEKRVGYRRALAGTGGTYWTDAWHRAQMIGRAPHWEFDAEGWRGFLRQLLPLVAPHGLSPEMERSAVQPVLDSIEDYGNRATLTPRHRAQIAILARNCPARWFPSAYRHLLPEPEPAAESATQPQRRGK